MALKMAEQPLRLIKFNKYEGLSKINLSEIEVKDELVEYKHGLLRLASTDTPDFGQYCADSYRLLTVESGSEQLD